MKKIIICLLLLVLFVSSVYAIPTKQTTRMKTREKEFRKVGEFLEQQRETGKPQRLAQYVTGLSYIGFIAFKGVVAPPIFTQLKLLKNRYQF